MTQMAPRLAIALFCAASALGACAGGSTEGSGAAISDAAKHPLVNNPAPEFVADSKNGPGKVSLTATKGKVVIVDFWATWCEPCKKSFPRLQELFVKYKSSGLEIVGVSEDDDGSGIREFGENYGATFPLVWDSGKAVAGKWQPKSMPSSFVVDKKGVIRFVHLGYHDGEEAEIEKEVKSLL